MELQLVDGRAREQCEISIRSGLDHSLSTRPIAERERALLRELDLAGEMVVADVCALLDLGESKT